MWWDCRALGLAPRSGGWVDQDNLELAAMRVAARAAEVYTKSDWTPADAGFIDWVNGGAEDGG